MSGRARVTAASAVVASLGLTGAVLFATAPMTTFRADAAQVAAADPTQIEPTDPTITDDTGDPEAEPTVTVTITESPDPTVTKTTTVTPKPTKKPTKSPTASKSPKPTKSPTSAKTSPVVPPPAAIETPPSSTPLIPSSTPLVPSTPAESPAPDPQISLALASPTPTPSPSETPSSSFDEPTPDSVPIEIRNASPEYDQLTLSRKLAIPGVLLAVLVMLGILVFEGRIRRVAHAAAIRKAGPRGRGRSRGDDFPGQPMPGYPVFQGGMAYAPIISFVPVQGYPAPGQTHPGGPGYVPGQGYVPGEGYVGGHGFVPGQTYPPMSEHGFPVPHDPQAYGAAYEQGLAGPVALPAAGPAEPWPRADQADATATFPAVGEQPGAGQPGPAQDSTAAFPAVGEQPGAGLAQDAASPSGPVAGPADGPAPSSPATDGATLWGPLPTPPAAGGAPGAATPDAKPRRGLLGRFRRDPS